MHVRLPPSRLLAAQLLFTWLIYALPVLVHLTLLILIYSACARVVPPQLGEQSGASTPPEPMMPTAYSTYFHKIYKFPSISVKFINFPPFSFNLGFFPSFTFFSLPYFDHDASCCTRTGRPCEQ